MDAAFKVAHRSVMQSHEGTHATERLLISVVDDDVSIRESLRDLVGVFGFAARAFASAEEFLSSDSVDQTRCLILDVFMPGTTGPDLQRELKFREQPIPIVFMTAEQNETIRREVLAQGAVECLFKPFSDADLLKAINAALRIN
ncbi:MAG: response regulator [Candidatus Sulfotelmatobacter sp.]